MQENPRPTVETFWNQDQLVHEYSSPELIRSGANAYEIHLIEGAVSRARESGDVATVIVLGVGAGRELTAVAERASGAAIRAYDISQPMVEACRRTVSLLGLDNVEVERCDMSDLPLPAESVDVIIAVGAVLGYSTRAGGRLADFRVMSNLLRRGGTVAIVVQQVFGRPDWAAWLSIRSALAAMGAVAGGIGDRLSRCNDAGVLFHHYTRRELTGLCAAAGFDPPTVCSLRQWGREHGHDIPLRSPNPLILGAVRGPPS